MAASEKSPYDSKEEEFKEQTKNIGGQQFELGLKPGMAQEYVVEVMHKMVHQKVKAEDKWGAIPMSDDTVSQLIEFLEKSDLRSKDALLKIAHDWKAGNFSHADKDHNFFWEQQGGTIGKAYGLLTPEEEAEFIKNNFENK